MLKNKAQSRRICKEKGVKELVERIAPEYVTYEYITRSREELAEDLEKGRLDR